MNLSLWDTYSADQQQTLKAKIVQETKAHEMPLLQYQVIHWNTRITDADIRAFVQWSPKYRLLKPGARASREGDPVRGRGLRETLHRMPFDGAGSRGTATERSLWARLGDRSRVRHTPKR